MWEGKRGECEPIGVHPAGLRSLPAAAWTRCCARPLPIQRVRAVPLKPHPGPQEADKEIQN